MTTPELLKNGYHTLLKAYPAWFQAGFGREMDSVFAEALQSAYSEGWWAVCRLGWREIRDWPVAVSRQYWFGWHMEVTKMEKTNSRISNSQSLPDVDGSTAKPSTLEIFAPLLLFLVWGAAWIYAAAWDIFPALQGLSSTFWGFLVAHAVTLIGMGVGWKLNFPRWSYLYVGMAVTFTIYWPWTGMIDWQFLVLDFSGWRWPWLDWVPFLVLAAIMLVWTRSLQPVRQFFIGIWKDWSQLSLVFYAWLIYLLMTIQLDSIERPYEIWSVVWMVVAFLSGVVFYVLASTPWKRALGLDLGIFAGVGGVIFLGKLLNPDVQQFASYASIAPEHRPLYLLFMGGWVLVCLGLVFLPAVLVLFQRSKRVAPAV
jgi:hypothetical protein